MDKEPKPVAKRVESLPPNISPKEILARPDNSSELFFRFPEPGEFLTYVPRYANVTHDDILIIKRRANTLAILEPGSYEIDIDLIIPSTDYFAFIRTADYLLDWTLPAILDTEEREEVIIGLSGTMILKVTNLDLAAYNLIVTTRGMMDEFKQWLLDQINIILKKKSTTISSMEKPPGEEFFTQLLQQSLEEPFSFLGLELKGIQVTTVKIIKFPEKEASSPIPERKIGFLGIKPVSKPASPKNQIRDTRKKPTGKEISTLALSMPSEVIIGLPKKLKVRYTTMETEFPKEILIKAHSPSFLFHESEKSTVMDRATTEVEFDVVATKPGVATIHVSAYSTSGDRLVTSRIDTMVIRESYEVIGHLLKQYAISSVILFFGMIAGLISVYWLGVENIRVEALYLTMGTLLGLTLAALTAFAERSRE